jgi:amidase
MMAASEINLSVDRLVLCIPQGGAPAAWSWLNRLVDGDLSRHRYRAQLMRFKNSGPLGCRYFQLIAIGAALLTANVSQAATFKLEEATLDQIQSALDAGALSSVELTALYLNRIHAYDRNGIKLNSIPVLNPHALDEAALADRTRAQGKRLGPLHGIPYTVKDSYKVKGLTVAAGSPAFATLIANEDAFTVARVREAGGVLIGKTNMPPLANGGMQRGVYGRAESPYNGDYLTAAWASGSSNGSATATAANFAVFGMGEETVSSGRSPASNNGLVAYTPSRGLISIRGNWPLFPMRDVVVPHTRTVRDMLSLLEVVVVDDPITQGDFWREQNVVKLPKPSATRPASFGQLADKSALRGKRIAVPTMYIGKDANMRDPIKVRPSIIALWEKAAADLRALGATVVEVDFEPMHAYEADRPGMRTVLERGLMPEGWWFSFGPGAPRNVELFDLTPSAYESFLKSCNDPNFPSWSVVDASQVFPDPSGSVEAKGKGLPHGYAEVKATIVAGVKRPAELPKFKEALEGVEKLRKLLFEDWLAQNQFDAVVFPANADIGKADADVNDASYDDANRNGVRFSNMNHAIRHLGIPSVSVAMGTMSDTGMPVNLTFAGPAYADAKLLSFAYAYEQATHHRRAPTRVPALDGEVIEYNSKSTTPPARRKETKPPELRIEPTVRVVSAEPATIRIAGTAQDASGIASLRVYVNGHQVVTEGNDSWSASLPLTQLNRWRNPAAGSFTVLVLAKDKQGNTAADLKEMTAPPAAL